MSSENHVAVFIFVTILIGLGFHDDPFKTCNRYTSFGYGYRDFFEYQHGNFSPNQVFYLEFYVKTSSDAHILLKSDVADTKGYEIVIGGGSNTFSQIRLLEPETKKTMITQKTENFLSEENYRLFWISMDKLGIISVGKEDDEVFINWRFDEPFPVRAFSFGSWTNMKADWRFGCKARGDSDIIHEEGTIPPLKKLKRDLFTLYDPNALPVDEKSVLEVKVNFQVNNVQLNEKRGEFTVYGTADLKWIDPKMKWKPENYDAIDTIFVPPFQIWTPNMRVLNALAVDSSSLFDLSTTGVAVRNDGSVFWRPPFKTFSHCTVDLKHWPYDVHNCSVLFGFWLEPDNLVMSMMDEYDTLLEKHTESQWQIVKVIPFNTHHPDEGENYGILYIEIRRMNGALYKLVIVPYIAAISLNLISFWLTPESSVKLYLRLTTIVILLLLLFIVGGLVPAMTEGVPRIILFYSWTLIVSCFPILLYVILKNVQFVELPQSLSKLLSNRVFSQIFCLPDLNEITSEYFNFNDKVNELNKNHLNSRRLIVVIERISFLGYLLAITLLSFLI